MTVITLPESDQLLQSWDLSPLTEHFKSWDRPRFRLPKDSLRKSALARHLVKGVVGDRRAATFVFDWEVFEMEENSSLFDLVRKGFGEKRPLHEAGVHVTTGIHDADELFAIAALVQYFIWSCLIVTSDGEIAIYISHDEVFSVQIRDLEVEKEFTSDIESFLKADQFI